MQGQSSLPRGDVPEGDLDSCLGLVDHDLAVVSVLRRRERDI